MTDKKDEREKLKLTDEQKEKIKQWIEEKSDWPDRKCEICGGDEWVIGDHLVTPIVITEGGVHLGGINYSQFMIVCSSCGHTHYFNALIAGITHKDKNNAK